MNIVLFFVLEEKQKNLNGQYLHAFCAGLTKVLKPYQDALVQIEEQVYYSLKNLCVCTKNSIFQIQAYCIF